LRLPEGGSIHLPQTNVIVLRRENGRLVRLTQPIRLGDAVLRLKPIGPATTHMFSSGPLWPHLSQPFPDRLRDH
jgi:hypothetical protein